MTCTHTHTNYTQTQHTLTQSQMCVTHWTECDVWECEQLWAHRVSSSFLLSFTHLHTSDTNTHTDTFQTLTCIATETVHLSSPRFCLSAQTRLKTFAVLHYYMWDVFLKICFYSRGGSVIKHLLNNVFWAQQTPWSTKNWTIVERKCKINHVLFRNYMFDEILFTFFSHETAVESSGCISSKWI